MYENDVEIENRLSDIFNRISNFDFELEKSLELVERIYEKEVLERTIPRSTNYLNSIEIALMLVSGNKISDIFWKSYAQTYQVSNSNFFTDLDVGDIKSILSIMERESKLNESLKITLEKFERFISTNGLLKNFSKNYIEFNPSMKIDNTIAAFGILNDSDELLEPIIFHGKTMLSRIIFNVFGLNVVSENGINDYIEPQSILKSDINFFLKRNLIKNVEVINEENYKKLFDKEFFNFSSTRREYIYSFVKTEELLDKISLESYGFKDEEDDFEMIVGFKDILEANLKEFQLASDSGHYSEMIQELAHHSIKTLREVIDEKYRLFHRKETISIAGLTLIAGLSNQDSVKNILNKGNGELVKKSVTRLVMKPYERFRNEKSVEIESKSAIQWLRDSKRKYNVYELIEDKKPYKNIDYFYVHEEVEKVRERVKKLKKTKVVFSDNDFFVRTNKKFIKRVKDHNRKRCEWIGKGKTFKELNEKNSTYRKNIKRQTYKKNKSPITQDILYDLNSGYIEMK